MVSELAQVKGISRAAISQGVDGLVGRGLLRCTTDERDRRYIRLDLTAEGDALLDAVLRHTKAWMAGVFASLSDEELASLVRAADALKRVPVV